MTLGAFLGRFVFPRCSLCCFTNYHFLSPQTCPFSSLGFQSGVVWAPGWEGAIQMCPNPVITHFSRTFHRWSASHPLHPQPDRLLFHKVWKRCLDDISTLTLTVNFLRFVCLQIFRLSPHGCSCGRCASSLWSAVCHSTSSNIWSGNSPHQVIPNSPPKLSIWSHGVKRHVDALISACDCYIKHFETHLILFFLNAGCWFTKKWTS